MTLAGMIVGALGVLFLIVGAVSGVRLRSFLAAAVAATGKVVGFQKRTDNEGGSSKHAQVEFATADGQTVTFTEKSQTFGGLSVGSEVPVRYDAGHPGKARIATSGRLWASVVWLVVLGVVALVVGVILLLIGD